MIAIDFFMIANRQMAKIFQETVTLSFRMEAHILVATEEAVGIIDFRAPVAEQIEKDSE